MKTIPYFNTMLPAVLGLYHVDRQTDIAIHIKYIASPLQRPVGKCCL
jgi:hypothetical protein